MRQGTIEIKRLCRARPPMLLYHDRDSFVMIKLISSQKKESTPRIWGTKLLAPLRVIKNGFNRSVKLDMNRSRAASRLVSCCTPFLEVGA